MPEIPTKPLKHTILAPTPQTIKYVNSSSALMLKADKESRFAGLGG